MRIAFFLSLPLIATVLLAGEYSAEDRGAALAKLDESRRIAVVSVERVTQKQSTWTPDSNRWTILQVIEHLALAEDYLFGLLEKNLAEVKPLPDTDKLPDPSQRDMMISRMMADRTHKAQAPADAVPSGRFSNRDEAMAAFTKAREKTAAFVRTTKLDLRRYQISTPMGNLDGHQWILMMAAHTERHVKQIEEVMGNENYPTE
jgi:hypothetical protein